MTVRRALAIIFLLASAAIATAEVTWRRIDSAPGGILPPPPRDVEPTASLALDVDGDGAVDFIIGGRNAAPALTLWRYVGGRWTTEVIEPDSVRIEAGGAAFDIDGDGDLDVVFGGDYRSGEIWWWENPHPARGRWTRRVLKRDAMTQHHDQLFGDFDGDGKPELVAWNQRSRSLLHFPLPADPKADALWPVQTIFSQDKGTPPEGLSGADIDGDGITDIVGGGYWFKSAGAGKFTAHLVDPAMGFSRAAAGQLVEGGRPEIVFGPGDSDGALKWYQWVGDTWVAHTLEEQVTHGHSLQLGDIDGDGHLDVLLGEMGQWTGQVNNPNARVLVYYGDGRGNFRRQLVSTGQGVHECRLVDLDGDGRLDILAKPFRHNTPLLVVWLNQGPPRPPTAADRPENKALDRQR